MQIVLDFSGQKVLTGDNSSNLMTHEHKIRSMVVLNELPFAFAESVVM